MYLYTHHSSFLASQIWTRTPRCIKYRIRNYIKFKKKNKNDNEKTQGTCLTDPNMKQQALSRIRTFSLPMCKAQNKENWNPSFNFPFQFCAVQTTNISLLFFFFNLLKCFRDFEEMFFRRTIEEKKENAYIDWGFDLSEYIEVDWWSKFVDGRGF